MTLSRTKPIPFCGNFLHPHPVIGHCLGKGPEAICGLTVETGCLTVRRKENISLCRGDRLQLKENARAVKAEMSSLVELSLTDPSLSL